MERSEFGSLLAGAVTDQVTSPRLALVRAPSEELIR
jgi:hypothetical protein